MSGSVQLFTHEGQLLGLSPWGGDRRRRVVVTVDRIGVADHAILTFSGRTPLRVALDRPVPVVTGDSVRFLVKGLR